MKKNLLTLIFIAVASIAFAQASYNGCESIEFDAAHNRYLVSNNANGKIIARSASGTLSVFATGISPNPYGIEIVGDTVYACCSGYIKGFSLATGAQVFNLNLGATFLNGITHDNSHHLFATDFNAKTIYRININSATYNIMASGLVQSPNGIIYDGANNRLVFVNWGSNAKIKAISLIDSTVTTLLTTTLSSFDGIARDNDGNYFVSNWGSNSVVKYNNNFTSAPVTVMTGLNQPADIYYNLLSDTLAVPNSGNDVVSFLGFNLINNTVCSDLPLTANMDSIFFQSSGGQLGTDSMIRVLLTNNSTYGFAYPLAWFEFLDPLPTGMSIHPNYINYEVFETAWNASAVAYPVCLFNVSQPIPPNYMLHFKLHVTNLSPSSVDTCVFSQTFVVNLNYQSTSVGNSLNQQQVSVYPNPTTSEIIISGLMMKENESIIIYDVTGRELNKISLKNNSNSTRINIQDLNDGIYLLKYFDKNGKTISTGKFVKE